jgi:hypothetical protein
MILKIIIFFIILILFWIRKINKSKNVIQKKDTKFKNNSFSQMKEDRNYAALKKMFFYPNAHSINFVNIKRPNMVYGILIEQSISDKKKILFASYITGFAGYYKNYGGGFIKGKLYEENSDVQQELMELYYRRNLDGAGQDIKTQKLATRLLLKANKLINHTVNEVNGVNWSLESEKIKIYLRTKNDDYFAEVNKSNINNSIWKEIIDESQTIIKLLEQERINKFFSNNDDLPF